MVHLLAQNPSKPADIIDHDTSLLDYAATTARRFNSQPGDLFHQDFDSLGFKHTKFLELPRMDIYPIVTLPLILQDIYDHVKKTDQPPLLFFSKITRFSSDGKAEKTYLLDAEAARNEDLKRVICENCLKQPVLVGIGVASKDERLDLPAADMAVAIEKTKKDMFDKSRYHPQEFDGGDLFHRGLARRLDKNNAADRLLEPMLRAYGSHLHTLDEEHLFVSDEAFDRMKQKEVKPARALGAGNGSGRAVKPS